MQYIRLKATLTNGFILYIREFISDTNRDYSYHVQNEKDNLIVRWDNAPHHPNISSFPHYKHDPEPEYSDEISLEDVLISLEDRFS